MAGDSTQFLIDIAARLTGADTAASSLSTLSDKLVGTGASAAQLDSAFAQASASYEAASAAATSAAEAVAAGSASYAEAERSATSAAKAAERMGQKVSEQEGKLAKALQAGDTSSITAAESKLANLVTQQERAKAWASSTAAALASEASALDRLKAAAAGAADEQKQLGASMKGLESAAKEAASAEKKAAEAASGSGKVNEMAEGLGRLGGPLGRVGQQALGAVDGLKKLGASMGSGIGLAVGLTVVVIALAVALAAGVVSVAKWAVGLADANRTQALTIAAVSSTSDSLAGLAGILPGVQGATGLATDELVGLAQQLDAAGVSAADMPAALRAVAMAEAALGKGAAAKLVEDLKAGKKSAAELAAEMDRKFGGIVAKKLLSLDSQAARLKTNLAATFGGLDIEPLLGGLSKLIGLFDSNTASGRALKQMFEGIFQPIIDGAVSLIPAIEGAFIQMEIWALKAQIALKPYAPIFATIGEGLSVIGSVLGAVLKPVVIAVAAGLALMLAPIYLVIAAIGWLVGAISGGLSSAWDAMTGAANSAWEALKAGPAGALFYLASLPGMLAGIGGDMIMGLVNGIVGNAGAIITSITGAVGGAIDAAKSMLGIHSPSKVFAGIGANTAAGFEEGIDDGAGGAQSALESMVEPPDALPAATSAKAAGSKAAGGKASGGSGLTVTGPFNFYGVEGAEDAERRMEGLFTRLLEGDVSTLGAEPAPA